MNNFHVIRNIHSLIKSRKKQGFSQTINHVYSHTMDEIPCKNYKTKIKTMLQKYGADTTTIIKGNRKADLLASSNQKKITSVPLNSSGLPTFFLYNTSAPVTSNLNKTILGALNQEKENKWILSKNRIPALKDPTVDTLNTLKTSSGSLPPGETLTDFMQKLLLNSLMTPSRIFMSNSKHI